MIDEVYEVSDASDKLPGDPTPEQLRERVAQVRASWSPSMRAIRWQGPRRERWKPQTISTRAAPGVDVSDDAA